MREKFQLFVIFTIFIVKIQAIDYDFTFSKNQTYYIDYEEKYNWFQAFIKCASMDMSLVTIDSQEKSDDLNDILINKSKDIPPLWIGALLNDLSPRQYSWISTGERLNFTNWADGQPNYLARQEYCIQLVETIDPNKLIQWEDEKCSRPHGLICEYSRYHNLAVELEEKIHNLTIESDEKLAESLDKQEQLHNLAEESQKKLAESLAKQQELHNLVLDSEEKLAESLAIREQLYNLTMESEEKLAESLEKQQQLQDELDKIKSEHNLYVNKIIRNIFLNIH